MKHTVCNDLTYMHLWFKIIRVMKENMVKRIANLINQINISDVKYKSSYYKSAYFADYKMVNVSQWNRKYAHNSKGKKYSEY